MSELRLSIQYSLKSGHLQEHEYYCTLALTNQAKIRIIILVIATNIRKGWKMSLKYSRQRQAIWDFVKTRTDHPTADTIYINVRQTYPNISLGTVYRNLMLLKSLGKIRTIDTGDGVVRFDPNTEDHAHFICKSCGCVDDLMDFDAAAAMQHASHCFSGKIISCDTLFYGLCEECLMAENTPENVTGQKIES